MKNKFPLMLLALACAVLVWLYDVTVVNPNDSVTFSGVPVVFENEEALRMQGLMVTSGNDITVSLKISGRRSELKKLTRGNIQLGADLSQIGEAGQHELSYTVRYPANVSSGDLQIDNRSPAYVSVMVEHYIRRAVEVRAVFEGDAAQDLPKEFAGSFAAHGMYGQRISVFPALDMVVAHKSARNAKHPTRGSDYRELVKTIIRAKKNTDADGPK